MNKGLITPISKPIDIPSGESKVYNMLFETTKDKGWHVHYSYRIPSGLHPKNPNGSEVDFIIIGESIWIILLEVKGGGIFLNRGKFFTTNRAGTTSEIQNPFNQINNNWGAFRKYYSESLQRTIRKNLLLHGR